MEKIAQKVLEFFSSINEFDKRTLIRDCTDILINNRKELISLYPEEAFMFVKIARIHCIHMDNKKFSNFLNKATGLDEKFIDEFIDIIVTNGTASAMKFNEQINKLKNDENYIGRSEFYEPSL